MNGDASQLPAGNPRRHRVLLLSLLAISIGAYFAWPRSVPQEVVLPRDHDKPTVKSWLAFSWSLNRQYFIHTEVPRGLEQVVDEITAQVSRQSRGRQMMAPGPANDIPGRRVVEVNRVQVEYVDDARKAGGPRDKLPMLFGGGYGRPMPQSFATFWTHGPENGRTVGLSHRLYYRLHETELGRTVVEVWVLKRSHP